MTDAYDFEAPQHADLTKVELTEMSPTTQSWFGARVALCAIPSRALSILTPPPASRARSEASEGREQPAAQVRVAAERRRRRRRRRDAAGRAAARGAQGVGRGVGVAAAAAAAAARRAAADRRRRRRRAGQRVRRARAEVDAKSRVPAVASKPMAASRTSATWSAPPTPRSEAGFTVSAPPTPRSTPRAAVVRVEDDEVAGEEGAEPVRTPKRRWPAPKAPELSTMKRAPRRRR